MLYKNSVAGSRKTEYFLFFLYLTTSITFLFFDKGYMRYILNISLLALTFLVLYSVPLKNKAVFIVVSTIVYISYMSLSSIFIDRDFSLSVYNSFYSYYIVSYIVLFSNDGKYYLRYIYNYFYIIVSAIFLILLIGFDPSDIFSGSRNTISLLLIPMGAILILDKRLQLKKLSGLAFYLMIFFSSTMSLGRSGIITSILLLIAFFFYSTNNINYRSIFIVALSVIILVLFLNTYYDTIINISYFDYLNNRGIEDDYRETMRREYLSSLNPYNVVLGISLSSLPYISSYSNNPHNTYLFLHSYLGLLFLLVFFFVLLYWLKLFFRRDLASILAMTAIILRFSTDSASDITMLPIIFVFLLFFREVRFPRKYENNLTS